MTHVMYGTTKRGAEFAKQIVELIKCAKGFERNMEKVRITDGGNGKCFAEFTVGPEHLNRGGTLHGGFTATLVDMITTYALMSKPCFAGVSVNLNVNYLKGAREGDEILVDANTIRAGKKLAFIECELRQKKDGSVVARGNQTKYVELSKKDAEKQASAA